MTIHNLSCESIFNLITNFNFLSGLSIFSFVLPPPAVRRSLFKFKLKKHFFDRIGSISSLTTTITMTMSKLFVRLTLVTALAVQTLAFTPCPALGCRRHTLISVASTSDDYDAFERGSPMAWKDIGMGEGEGAADGDVVTVDFKGFLFSSGKTFAKNEAMTFKIGAGKAFPGFDRGLLGVKQGTKRLLRVPSNMAYGAKGAAPTIPANADLEYEIDVTKITPSGMMGELALFGEARAAGIAVCVAVLAVIPVLFPTP
jgi:hypothetical protein